MKRILFFLTTAALLCCSTFSASARDTDRSVAAQLDSPKENLSKIKFVPIPRADRDTMFGVSDLAGGNEVQWQVLNIPIFVGAKKVTGPDGQKVYPNYVPEISFHIYLLLDAANATDEKGKKLRDRERCIMLEKDVTYVNIPLQKTQNRYVGETMADAGAVVNAAFFLSPYDINRIMEKDSADYENPKGTKSQPNIAVVAFAMEATYRGAKCWHRDRTEKKLDYFPVKSDAKSWLLDNWWKRPSGGSKNRGARLMTINETPFAASYYPTYYATRPLYGTAEGAAPSTKTGLGDTKADSTATDTPAADTTAPAADTTPAEDDDTTATGTDGETGGKPSRRGRKNRS